MSNINDGGPAFPASPSDTWLSDTPHGGGGWASSYGIETPQGTSLRDWFAGKAMAARISNHNVLMSISAIAKQDGTTLQATIAALSYATADAMIAERAKATGEAK